jgi:hypothetical protein
MENLNSVFCKMFAWFMAKYGCTSVDNCKANCTTMVLEWHPSQGFELLVALLFWGATCANLTKHPIPNNDIVNIGICAIHQTGLFAEEYKAWITRGNNPTNNMDFTAFRSFWETAINIASFTATPAWQYGYGMNTVKDNPSAAYPTNAVSNFGTVYAAMQESLRNNNASINAMQGLIQMLCNALGNQPPAGSHNIHNKLTRDVEHKTANMANNTTKANKDNPVAAVVAPTMVAGKIDSTEATATVAEVTEAMG